MDKKEASEKIAALTSEAMSLIRKAEEIADKSGVSFDFDLAYGMGGNYVPKGTGSQWESSGWNSSSSYC